MPSTDQKTNRAGRLPYCGNLTHAQIWEEFRAIYEGADLRAWDLKKIHNKWRDLAKQTRWP